ncbi:hypothetical protein [Psychrobacter lutiphocae]|uniref:hypothetical protein n=1 Tax=Psychrobacter lutiphocae TaxID=540500 RepID=UPI000376C4A1|nr:hypothetical protein [Psychrobacter lutiphocae]
MSNINQSQLAQLQEVVSDGHLNVALSLGQAQFAEFNEKLAKVARIKLWAEIKNSKEYKGLRLVDPDGNWRHIATWEDFCQCQGKSRRTVDEEIQNLEVFGEDFFESSKKIGLSTRDLRKLRKLPDAEREVIINGEAVQAEDKETLIDLIEEMSAKHVKTRDALQQQINELQADAKAKDSVLSTKNKKIDELDAKLSLRKDPDQKLAVQKELEAHISSELAQAVTSMLTAISQFNNSIITLKEQAVEDVPHLTLKIDSDVSYTYNRIAELAAADGIEINLAEMITPDWMHDALDPDNFQLQGQTPEELAQD